MTEPVEPFTIGQKVSKIGGDYRFDGRVVAKFFKLSGALRYVVEDDRGVLHVYSHKNLRKSDYCDDGVAQRIEHGDSTSGVAGSSPAAVTTKPSDCNTPPASVCDVCRGTGYIYVRTMHDPDGPREKQECEECHAPAPVCEWRLTNWSPDTSWHERKCDGKTYERDLRHLACPSCGLPIKLTEAQR